MRYANLELAGGFLRWRRYLTVRSLCVIRGPLLRYEQTSPATLALQIGPDLYIGESGAADDFVNHCCDPNAGGCVIDGHDVRLIATRDIAIGEQITFDYSTTMDEDDFEFDCLCGSSQCRGLIRDFKHLPANIKARYTRLGRRAGL